MKRITIALGAVLAWVCGVCGATHEGVQLWENGPLWAKTNIGANSPTEAGYYFWWGDTIGYKWQNSKWVASDGSVNNFNFSTANCPTYGKSLAQLLLMQHLRRRKDTVFHLKRRCFSFENKQLFICKDRALRQEKKCIFSCFH